jgi:hypothetical protein
VEQAGNDPARIPHKCMTLALISIPTDELPEAVGIAIAWRKL